MDGSPLARLVVVLIFLVLMGLPVVALTREKPVAAEEARPAKVDVGAQSVDLAVTLSQPGKVEIRLADQVVASSEVAVPSLKKTITLPGERSDLTVKFQWADGGANHAGRVVVSRDGDTVADQTFWGDAVAEDVLNVRLSQP